MFLRLGGVINFVMAIMAIIQGNLPGAMVHMAACILMDLQADVMYLKEVVLKLEKGAKDATQSQES